RIVARDGFEDAARVGTAARLRHLHVVRRTRKKLERPENALLLPDFAALEQVEHGLRPLRLGQGRKRALEERRAGEVYEGQRRAKSGSERRGHRAAGKRLGGEAASRAREQGAKGWGLWPSREG